MKTKFIYYRKLLKKIVFYDLHVVPKSYSTSDFTLINLIIRFSQLFAAIPVSLLAWMVLRIIFVHYKVSIYVLKSYRPSYASTYLGAIEPLCRKLQHDNLTRHIKILVQPGASVSIALDESYSPHFSMYLDDKRKFARLVAYLIPKQGIEKIHLDTSYRFDLGWFYPSSKNFVNQNKQVPLDLQELGIKVQNFALFVHPSLKYYLNRFDENVVESFPQCFIDLSTYKDVLLDLTNQDLKVIRLGTDVDELVGALKGISIIDYVGETRNELSELWLYENCKILISVANGAFHFARRFERPCIITDNYAVAVRIASSVPMLIINNATGQLLSFAEMAQVNRQKNAYDRQIMMSQNLEYVQNSPETLKNAVSDVLNFSNNLKQYDDNDKKLVNRYLQICENYGVRVQEKFSPPPISFLKEFSYLLD